MESLEETEQTLQELGITYKCAGACGSLASASKLAQAYACVQHSGTAGVHQLLSESLKDLAKAVLLGALTQAAACSKFTVPGTKNGAQLFLFDPEVRQLWCQMDLLCGPTDLE